MSSTKILVGVCTYQRPQMLKSCLDFIALLELEPEQEAVCIVVNNDTSPLPKDLIEFYQNSKSSIDYQFADCTERGIPQARNVILELADNEGFDYCAFLDDDEYPTTDWLTKLVAYQVASGSDAVQGEVINVFEDKPWLLEPLLHDVKFGKEEGHVPHVVSTCNVLMTRDLFSTSGKHMRFDPNLALTGGSDKDLFNRAREAHGTVIKFTPDACVYETIPASRTTLKWFFQRFARIESNKFIFKAKKSNHLTVVLLGLPKALKYLLDVIFYTITIALTFYIPEIRRRKTIKLTRNAARLWGFLSSATGNHINPYKNTTGC
ncbi:glycosyltransferase family 2 protein [Rubritalea sp.]|uniref:glycosyltransferase family 2 protein n=1 Tax=Rubritalea sp. TaxID=2109375 RepID=UPI003EF68704